MTDTELDKKIQDIKAERDRLGNELRKYEQQRTDKRNQDELSECMASIGKCYLRNDDNDRNSVRAFKIISIPDQAGKTVFANCLIIRKYGISLSCYNVWGYAKPQMIVTDFTRVIDSYTEIDQDEFDSLLADKISMMNEAATGKDVFEDFPDFI